MSLAAGGNSCNPPRPHPGGKIIDKVAASNPWSVAVRDDGLAHFTELFNNRVGITNTTTRTVRWAASFGYRRVSLIDTPSVCLHRT